MVDPVSAAGVRPPQELYNLDPVSMGPGEVSPADQQRFEALSSPEGPAAADGGNMTVAQASEDFWVRQPVATEPEVPPPTLGETILDGLDNLRNGWSDIATEVQATVDSPGFDPADLMNLQWQVQHTGLVMTMVVNEISALDTEIGTLLKTA